MKTLALILLTATLSYSQAIFKMNMHVQEVNFGVKECSTEEVYWGMKQDTVCFIFKSKLRCYYPINRKINRKLKLKVSEYVRKYSVRGETFLVVQDDRNEVYIVRIIVNRNKAEVLIFIINVNFGIPNFVLGFNCSECI